VSDSVIIRKESKNCPYDFLAHGCIRQNGKYFELEDWDDDKKTNITALGKFDKIRVKRILELFKT